MSNSDWIPIFSAHTTRDELEVLIEEEAQSAVDDLRTRLEAQTNMPPAQCDVLARRLLPAARDKTREAFEAAWRDLQLEAAGRDETVH